MSLRLDGLAHALAFIIFVSFQAQEVSC